MVTRPLIGEKNEQGAFDMSHWEVGQPFVVHTEIGGAMVAVGEYQLESITPDLQSDLRHTMQVLRQFGLISDVTVAKMFVELNRQNLTNDAFVISNLFSILLGNATPDTASPVEALLQDGVAVNFTNLAIYAAQHERFNREFDQEALVAALTEGAQNRHFLNVTYREYGTDYSQFAPIVPMPLKVNNFLGSNAQIIGINDDFSVHLANIA